jgi:polysaccharide biosynthesis PFTS motif protein
MSLIKIKYKTREKIRAYEKNIKDGNIFIFRKILNDFSSSYNKFKQFKTPISKNHLNDAFNQIIYTRFYTKDLYLKINYSLFNNNHSIVAPIPKNYREILESYNIKVVKYLCAILFFAEVMKYYLYGILFSIKLIVLSARFINCSKIPIESVYLDEAKHSYFDGSDKYNLNSFLKRTYGKSVILSHSCSNIPKAKNLSYIKNPYDLPFSSWMGYFKFVRNVLMINCTALFGLLIGRWHYAFLLSEIIKYYRILESLDHVSKSYLFPFSNNAYRPIWTYALKSRGVNSESFFYSTYESPSIKGLNTNNFKINSLYLSSWDAFYVWDDRHAKILTDNLSKMTKIIISGPISTSDFIFAQNKTKNNSINLVIFDVPPYRRLVNWPWASIAEYEQINGLKKKFLEDIISLRARYSNINIYIKSKRGLDSMHTPSYLYFVNKHIRLGNLININSNVSPRRLADLNFLSISFPCTSTALFFKPNDSVYYDPLNLITYDQAMFRNRKLLTDPSALSEWILTRI